MRAATLSEPGRPLTVVEVDDPVAGPGEVVLAVHACGICGSDLHASEVLPIPGLVMGHELCGTVAEVGPEVEGWAPGDRAAALSLVTCGRCAACLSGRVRKCALAKMVGIETPGAYAERLAMPARDLHRLPDHLDLRLGALVEPLAVALHTVARAGGGVGDDVVVLGAGPIGLAVVLWLRHAGVREIVVSDPVATRRAMAERLAPPATMDPTTQDVAGACAGRRGQPARHVVECVGVPGLIQHAVDVSATDGVVTVAGVCMADDEIVPWLAMAKELDVRFAFYYTRPEFETVIDALATDRIDASPLITGEVDLDGLPEIFEALKRPSEHAKVLVRP